MLHAATAARQTTRPQARARWHRVLAATLALALLAIGLAARHPVVHEHVHHDEAHHEDHACAITLAASGFCDTAAPAPQVEPGRACVDLSFPEPGSFSWVTPAWWLVPAHAPPTLAA